MKATFVSPAQLSLEVMKGLLGSFAHRGLTLRDVAHLIRSGEVKLFQLELGEATATLAVSVMENPLGRALQLDGFWIDTPGQGYKLRTVISFLQALAREWGCMRVETAVIDEKLMQVLKLIGCRVDYWALSFEVGHGQ